MPHWSSPLDSLLDENLRKGLELIREKVREMGGLAERAVAASLRALTTQDRRLAHAIILKDDRIDDLEKQLDRLCLEFLVRQQPVGGHLRFLYSCIKLNTELERVGDYAESVARQVLDLSALPLVPAVDLITPIGELAIQMLHDAVCAFVTQDVELAKATIAHEDRVDQLRADIRYRLLELNRTGEMPAEVLVPLAIVTARYERVADQAVNVCEEVLYVCTGTVEKHKGHEMLRVLFLQRQCPTGLMAEAIASSLGLKQIVFSSASLEAGELDTRAIEFMQSKGIDIGRLACHALDQIPNIEHYQVVILLGSGLRQEARRLPAKCALVPWKPPAAPQPQDSPDEARAALERLYGYLRGHIQDFVDATLCDEIYP